MECRKAKRVFISQPMRGRDDGAILEERAEVLALAGKALDCPVAEVKSLFEVPEDMAGDDMTALACLGRAIRAMSTADVAVFVPGWTGTRGCMVERACAEAYGVPILDLWDEEGSKQNDEDSE